MHLIIYSIHLYIYIQKTTGYTFTSQFEIHLMINNIGWQIYIQETRFRVQMNRAAIKNLGPENNHRRK